MSGKISSEVRAVHIGKCNLDFRPQLAPPNRTIRTIVIERCHLMHEQLPSTTEQSIHSGSEVVLSPQKTKAVSKLTVEQAQDRVSRSLDELERMKPKAPEWIGRYLEKNPLVHKEVAPSEVAVPFLFSFPAVSSFIFLPIFIAIPIAVVLVTTGCLCLESYLYGGKANKKNKPSSKTSQFLSTLFLTKKRRELADKRSVEASYYRQALEARAVLIDALRRELEIEGVFEALEKRDPMTGHIEQLVLSDDGTFNYVTKKEVVKTDNSPENRQIIESMVSRIKESLDKTKDAE